MYALALADRPRSSITEVSEAETQLDGLWTKFPDSPRITEALAISRYNYISDESAFSKDPAPALSALEQLAKLGRQNPRSLLIAQFWSRAMVDLLEARYFKIPKETLET